MSQEIIKRQQMTIEALNARINEMERAQQVTDKSYRDLIERCVDYQNQARELTRKLDLVRRAAA